jgi:hypothetical protein
MSKAEEILERLHFGNRPTTDVALAAMKEIAQLTWDECWGSTADGWNGEICPIPYQNDEDAKNYDINKNTFIKKLFGEEDI